VKFRTLTRAALGVVALLPFATCTDFTGPSNRGVRVPVVPVFSEAATFAKALYSSAGIEFDHVGVLIVRGESTVLKDTSVAFSASSAALTLPLLVTANPGEIVKVTLEYRAGDVILYSGTSLVATQSVGAPSLESPTQVVLIPVGPGSSAATVEISPASGSFPVSSSVTFTAQAFTADHAVIANALFGWTVDDPTVATVNTQGVVQATAKGGSVTVRATTLNGQFAEATVTFTTTSVAASLAIQSGGGQSAMALDPLSSPIVVKVLDASGARVSGVTVNFVVATGGGSVSVSNPISDASGLVSASWTLGPTVGTQSITATAAGLPNSPLTITATATERPATGAPHTWVGSASTSWHDPANWSPASVPTLLDSVTISPATNQPVVSDSASAKTIVIQANGALRINSVTLPIMNVPKVVILGTLRLSYGFISGDIDNRGTLLVDGFGIVNSVTATPTAITRIAGQTPDSAAILSVAHGISNDGTLDLTDVAGGASELSIADSLVNHATGVVTVSQGAGGQRGIVGGLRNYGAIQIQTSEGLILEPTQPTNVNAGSMSFTGGGAFSFLFEDNTQTFENTGTLALGTSDWTVFLGNLRLRSPGAVSGSGLLTAFETNLDLDLATLPLRLSLDDQSRFAGDSLVIPSGVTATFENSFFAQKVVVLGTLKASEFVPGQNQFESDLSIRNGGSVEISTDGLISGALTIDPGAMLKLVANGRNIIVHSDNSFTNAGLIEMTNTGSNYVASLEVDGTLTNAAGATISVFAAGERRIDAVLDNKGSIAVGASAYMTLPRDGVAHSNSGTISLADGVAGPAPGPENLLSFALQFGVTGSTLTNSGAIDIGLNRTLLIGTGHHLVTSGTIGGKGTVEIGAGATFSNTGIFAPGGVGKVGTMTFKGNYDIGPGSLDIDVASVSSADLLQVIGTASVTGKIRVTTPAGFDPSSGPNLTVLTGTSVVGSPTAEPAGFPGGWFATNTGNNTVQIFPNLGSPAPRMPD
jgi:hypothetical protein